MRSYLPASCLYDVAHAIRRDRPAPVDPLPHHALRDRAPQFFGERFLRYFVRFQVGFQVHGR